MFASTSLCSCLNFSPSLVRNSIKKPLEVLQLVQTLLKNGVGRWVVPIFYHRWEGRNDRVCDAWWPRDNVAKRVLHRWKHLPCYLKNVTIYTGLLRIVRSMEGVCVRGGGGRGASRHSTYLSEFVPTVHSMPVHCQHVVVLAPGNRE